MAALGAVFAAVLGAAFGSAFGSALAGSAGAAAFLGASFFGAALGAGPVSLFAGIGLVNPAYCAGFTPRAWPRLRWVLGRNGPTNPIARSGRIASSRPAAHRQPFTSSRR